MHDKLSFHKRSQADGMSASIAHEAREIVLRAAEPVFPGEMVGAQMRRAWTNLGRPAWWRMRAAWYGEAGCWSAAAMEELRTRFARWEARQEECGREEARALATVLGRFVAEDAEGDSSLAGADLAQARELVRRLCLGGGSGARG